MRLFLLILASLVLAGCQESNPDRFLDRLTEVVQTQLRLSSVQRLHWYALVAEARAVVHQRQAVAQKEIDSLSTAVSGPKVDRVALRQALDRRAQVGALTPPSSHSRLVDLFADFYDSLDLVQQKKFLSLRNQARAWMEAI